MSICSITTLREALLNAVVHKDYASGATIQISVYDDKLMIWSPVQFPPDWTAEDLLAKHESKPFNPDVAYAFFRAGMVESWGRGIKLILGECRRVGVPAPELSFKRSGFWVVFHYPPDHQAAIRAPRTGAETDGEPSTDTETSREPTQKPAQKPARKRRGAGPERILALLAEHPDMTMRVLAARVGLSLGGVRHHLERLKSAGRVRHVGPTKGGRWQVLE